MTILSQRLSLIFLELSRYYQDKFVSNYHFFCHFVRMARLFSKAIATLEDIYK
ncbi:hypothetical protein [Nostoc sp. UHCC 0252]|uniref:hypothetical protein n=1 Tax=Nostoc sp. UHCC 0252 TaxID=3110241 RepID=UPI002B2158A3|nr:hypothetical protein [Nostoc sp. UHCC 0252]MEA5599704.1 hypothetical protein [Nostoc sp. UHCC 0252]